MKPIEARIVKANGETGFAVFDSAVHRVETLLVLDKGDGHSISPVYFHPKQQALITESGMGVQCHYVASPIDIGKYQDLPHERRGFVLSD